MSSNPKIHDKLSIYIGDHSMDGRSTIEVEGTIEFTMINFNRGSCRVRFYPDDDQFHPLYNYDTSFRPHWLPLLKDAL